MREIVPFYKEPKKPENLLKALSSGAEIEKGIIDFERWKGRVSEVKEDGETKGVVVFLPSVDAEELFDGILHVPAATGSDFASLESERMTEQTALLTLRNGKAVRLAFQAIFGGVIVQAVDRNGTRLSCGNLITFLSEGTVRVIPGVNPHLGFRLNLDGGIQEG